MQASHCVPWGGPESWGSAAPTVRACIAVGQDAPDTGSIHPIPTTSAPQAAIRPIRFTCNKASRSHNRWHQRAGRVGGLRVKDPQHCIGLPGDRGRRATKEVLQATGTVGSTTAIRQTGDGCRQDHTGACRRARMCTCVRRARVYANPAQPPCARRWGPKDLRGARWALSGVSSNVCIDPLDPTTLPQCAPVWAREGSSGGARVRSAE
mmetsp:Transcript_143227/g.249959  ORF Transcript_143227/g.249959 Transcript_143227/m.249959 type:complete len:208 (-) Transcript_143227:1144-1767(-)